MAEEVLKKLEEQLNCSICLDTYTNPKLLQCFHVYCQQCLVPLVDRDQQGQLGLTCPTCRQVTPVPDREVGGLQSAFHINRFLEIQESFQKPDNSAAMLNVAEPTESPAKKASYCFVHEGRELELYCESCGELICLRCALKGGDHHNHDYEDLGRAFEKYQGQVTSSLEPMEKQVAVVSKTLACLDVRCREISAQRAATVGRIHSTFRQLYDVLNVREAELISEVSQMTQEKLKGLAAQKDQLETTLAQLNSCLHFMRESLRGGNERDVLMMKNNALKQIEDLRAPFHPDILKPNAEADFVFSASADWVAKCLEYGEVVAQSSPDPSRCYATGQGTEVTVVGEKSTAILQAINFEGKPCMEPIKLLECAIVSEMTQARAIYTTERKGSQYFINYMPTIKGRHQLSIIAEGKHVRGSPLQLKVRSEVKKLGAPILTLDGLKLPWGVAINQERAEVVITEHYGHCVSIFSYCGDRLRSFGTFGREKGQFWYPCGVAVDGEGNILVADGGNHRIQKFTHEGAFLASVGSKGSGPLKFALPTDVACGSKVYVADSGKHFVQVLDSDLTFSSTLGERESSVVRFNQPGSITCRAGDVYVADSENHCIQVFTSEGEFLHSFGKHGQERGELNRPVGVVVDTTGMVYVCEEGNSRVSLFTSGGQFVTSFGRRGREQGEFERPRGLAVDNSGVVYVCDRYNSRVQVF